MSVKIGSARIDENGKAKGGKAGDQTGREVSTQSWYDQKDAKKAWRVFRAKNPAQAEMIAQDMQWACDNAHIGYDQGQRGTLYDVSKPLGFNCAKVKTDCETDCSALVRVCCAYAGIMLPNFRTPTEPAVLLNSGAFEELRGDMYSHSSAYLRRGDILVTSTQGHTVVVLSNGPKADAAPPVPVKLGDRELRKGDKGEDVKELQADLMKLGYALPKYGADGDFGDATEMAVRAFQQDHGLTVDGVFGARSLAAFEKALLELDKPGEISETGARHVVIEGGNCYVRTAPNTDGKIIGVAKRGEKLVWQGETSEAGWLLVEYLGVNGWVSGKYGRLTE